MEVIYMKPRCCKYIPTIITFKLRVTRPHLNQCVRFGAFLNAGQFSTNAADCTLFG